MKFVALTDGSYINRDFVQRITLKGDKLKIELKGGEFIWQDINDNELYSVSTPSYIMFQELIGY